jgi:hypothetical protein
MMEVAGHPCVINGPWKGSEALHQWISAFHRSISTALKWQCYHDILTHMASNTVEVCKEGLYMSLK